MSERPDQTFEKVINKMGLTKYEKVSVQYAENIAYVYYVMRNKIMGLSIEEMKAKDAEIESLKQQITSNDKELDENHQMIFELQHDLKEATQQLIEFKLEYKIFSDNYNCECGSGQQNDGDTDLLGHPACSNCGNTIKL